MNGLRDKIRRELLGNFGIDSSPRAAELAITLSELSVRLVDAPKWWKDSQSGLERI